MKATIELPDALYREIRIRAAQEGKKVKELVAEYLVRGMNAPKATASPKTKARIRKDPVSGLPVILGGHPAPKGQELTPDKIKQVLLDQDVDGYFETCR